MSYILLLKISLLCLLTTPLLSSESLNHSDHEESTELTSDASHHSRMKINLYTNFNGQGLETDARILKKALEKFGHEVETYYWHETKPTQADINIFFENIVPDKMPYAKLNWFISNPEWYTQDLQLLDEIDLILCRTQESMRIFRNKKKIFFLGFTSPDAFRAGIEKDYSRIVHLPGGSDFQKGTDETFRVWKHSPHLPHLTLVDWNGWRTSTQTNLTIIPYRMEEKEYRALQNRCGIHLCPSSAEGFGHYIVEAMSTGAVVITTNGAPMNEFIVDPRCLINPKDISPLRLGVKYRISTRHLHDKVAELAQLPHTELKKIGERNRKKYEQINQQFYERLELLLDETKALLQE